MEVSSFLEKIGQISYCKAFDPQALIFISVNHGN